MRRVSLITLGVLVTAAPSMVAAQTPVHLASSPDTTCALTLARADRAFAVRRWREAADFYQSALAADDAAPSRWLTLGDALFNDNRDREAIAAYERALQLGAARPATAAWQISRAYARVGNRKQALRWLAHAVETGFDDREAIRHEPAFEPYRDDPRFILLAEAPRAASSDPPQPRQPRRYRLVRYTMDPHQSTRPNSE